MNYKVLYRKYRPKSFEEVVGQDTTISLLKDSIINDKISHAYIFFGPRGTGKTSAAKIFAKTINCLNPVDGEPCLQCENCLQAGSNPDIYEIDAASNNGVEQIREIIDNIKLSPINSKYKVYIIDEVHMLSTSAFNALLLTLEEPPSHVVFILATTNIENVPITVLSRCQRLDFKRISMNHLKDKLNQIVELEQIDITSDAIDEIAEYSEGGLRDALSILDQLSKLSKKIDVEDVVSALGTVSDAKIGELCQAVSEGDKDKIVGFIDTLRSVSADYKTVVKKIIKQLKKYMIEDGLIEYDMCFKMCFELADSLNKSNLNIDIYDLLELILVKPLYESKNMENTKSIIVEAKTEVTKEISENKEVVEDPAKVPEKINNENYDDFSHIRVNNTFVGANKQYLNIMKDNWQQFINTVDSKKIKGLLLDTNIVLASDKYAVISVELKAHADNINRTMSEIEAMFLEKFNESYKFVSISQDEWNDWTKDFKEHIAVGKKYVMLDEPVNDEKITGLEDIFSGNIEIR